VGNPHLVGQGGVAPGLGEYPFAGIHQNNGQIGGGRGGDHVAGVLLVAPGGRNDVFAPPGGKVAVGHVNGNALFTLGLETVGEEGQIHRRHAPLVRGALDGVEGVGQNGLGVVEQAPDQGAFAVIHAAAGEKAQQAVVLGVLFGGGHGKSSGMFGGGPGGRGAQK